MESLFTLSMNCQLTKNIKASVSGTISNSVSAIVALHRGNWTKPCNEFYAHFDDVCTLMMHYNDTSI